VTSSVAVFEAAIQVKSTHMTKSCLKPKKEKKLYIREIFT